MENTERFTPLYNVAYAILYAILYAIAYAIINSMENLRFDKGYFYVLIHKCMDGNTKNVFYFLNISTMKAIMSRSKKCFVL